MKNSIRIVITIIICLIGFLITFILGDYIYKIILFDLDFYSFNEIFIIVVLSLLSVSFILAFIFHIRIIRANTTKNQSILNRKIKNNSPPYLMKLVWLGNFIFGIMSILLAAQIFKTTIFSHINQPEKTLYYNYPLSIFIFLIGCIIIIDALKKTKQHSN